MHRRTLGAFYGGRDKDRRKKRGSVINRRLLGMVVIFLRNRRLFCAGRGVGLYYF